MKARIALSACLISGVAIMSGCVTTANGLLLSSDEIAKGSYPIATGFDPTRKVFVGTRLGVHIASRDGNWRNHGSAVFWDLVFLPCSVAADVLLLPLTLLYDNALAEDAGESSPSTEIVERTASKSGDKPPASGKSR